MVDSHHGNGVMNQEVNGKHEDSEENEDQKYEAAFEKKHGRSMNDEDREIWKREKD